MSELENIAWKAMLSDLCRMPKDGGEHGCTFRCDPGDGDGGVLLSGHVHLPALARAALRAIKEAGYEIRERDDILEVSRRAQKGLKL